jgi:hypothetical protein
MQEQAYAQAEPSKLAFIEELQRDIEHINRVLEGRESTGKEGDPMVVDIAKLKQLSPETGLVVEGVDEKGNVVNIMPSKAYTDSGAQRTYISEKFARQCGIIGEGNSEIKLANNRVQGGIQTSVNPVSFVLGMFSSGAVRVCQHVQILPGEQWFDVLIGTILMYDISGYPHMRKAAFFYTVGDAEYSLPLTVFKPSGRSAMHKADKSCTVTPCAPKLPSADTAQVTALAAQLAQVVVAAAAVQECSGMPVAAGGVSVVAGEEVTQTSVCAAIAREDTSESTNLGSKDPANNSPDDANLQVTGQANETDPVQAGPAFTPHPQEQAGQVSGEEVAIRLTVTQVDSSGSESEEERPPTAGKGLGSLATAKPALSYLPALSVTTTIPETVAEPTDRVSSNSRNLRNSTATQPGG